MTPPGGGAQPDGGALPDGAGEPTGDVLPVAASGAVLGDGGGLPLTGVGVAGLLMTGLLLLVVGMAGHRSIA